jgi:hypothetical protein
MLKYNIKKGVEYCINILINKNIVPLLTIYHETFFLTECSQQKEMCLEALYLPDIMLSRPLKINQHFKGTCHLHLEGQRISQVRNQNEADTKQDTRYLLDASFLLGFFFDPEDGGDMFFENIS